MSKIYTVPRAVEFRDIREEEFVKFCGFLIPQETDELNKTALKVVSKKGSIWVNYPPDASDTVKNELANIASKNHELLRFVAFDNSKSLLLCYAKIGLLFPKK